MGYPWGPLLMALDMYAMDRRLVFRGCVGPSTRARRGIGAGSATATRELALVMIRALDCLHAQYSTVWWCVQVDDVSATVPGKGDDLHRRSLYTYWKRSVPNPAMMLFDAPFREACVLRRPRTNTPLQALNLLNDPTYVEASRLLAQRMLVEGGESPESRISHGFRLVTARMPLPAEMAILKAALERTFREFQADPAAADSLLKVGEAAINGKLDVVLMASYTNLASTLLNLDETVTKE